MSEKNMQPERKYPAVYEKLVPIAIGVIVVIIIGMIILTLAIAFGWLV